MRVLFSETLVDYERYQFPYAVWGFLDPGETPATAFSRGFLPSGPELHKFYLTRSGRVRLPSFEPSSENRRILRKGAAFQGTLLPKEAFELTESRETFVLDYADQRFGAGVMDRQRLHRLWASPVISHVLVYTDSETAAEVGLCFLYAAEPSMVFYYFAFYDLNHPLRSLGGFMMTDAIRRFQEQGRDYLYQGTVYSKSALYKTQFSGFEFFNGYRWSADVDELKFLLRRAETPPNGHLLEDPDYLDTYANGAIHEPLRHAPTVHFPDIP